MEAGIIPQGSVLGPVLFLIYINDIDEVVKSTIIKFADDTKILRKVSTDEDIAMLQDDMDQLVTWSEDWQMLFNISKCKVIHIGRNNPEAQYRIKDEILEAAEQEKDLGVIISSDLKPSKQCAQAVATANRALGTIKRCFECRTVEIVKDLYLSRVRPHVEFAIQAWSPQYKKDAKLVEGVQRRATKLVRELKDEEYEERLKKFNLTTLVDRRLRGDMIEVHKMMNDEEYSNKEMLKLSHNTRTRGHKFKLEKPAHKHNARRHFFTDRVVDAWNSLPEHVVCAEDTNKFKGAYDRYRVNRTRGSSQPQVAAEDPGASSST